MVEHTETNNPEMIDLIKEKFADDPIYQECALAAATKDKLHPEFLTKLREGIEYSAQEASIFIERTDANIRYYLQNLPEYIGAVKSSSSYRMRYDGIYRLYLIFLYRRELNKHLKDIKVKIGEDPQLMPKRRVATGTNEETFDNLLIGLHIREKANLEYTEKMYKCFIEKSKKEQALNQLLIEQSKELTQIEETIRRLEDRKISLEGEIRRKRNEEKERLWQEKVRELEIKRKKESSIIGRLFTPITVEKQEVDPPTDDEINTSQSVKDLREDLKAIEEKLQRELEKAEKFSRESDVSKKIEAAKNEIKSYEQEILSNKSTFQAISDQSEQALAYFQKKKGFEIQSLNEDDLLEFDPSLED